MATSSMSISAHTERRRRRSSGRSPTAFASTYTSRTARSLDPGCRAGYDPLAVIGSLSAGTALESLTRAPRWSWRVQRWCIGHTGPSQSLDPIGTSSFLRENPPARVQLRIAPRYYTSHSAYLAQSPPVHRDRRNGYAAHEGDVRYLRGCVRNAVTSCNRCAAEAVHAVLPIYTCMSLLSGSGFPSGWLATHNETTPGADQPA
jgi:hypothetical protein